MTDATRSTTLMAANSEWERRPADQRFSSLASLHAAVLHHREVAVETPQVDLTTLRVTPSTYITRDPITAEATGVSVEPTLLGPSGADARFTHHAFGQIAGYVGAPAKYLRTLPAELVAENLNHGLQKRAERAVNAEANQLALLFAQNGELRLRAAVSQRYTRIWNHEVTARLLRLVDEQPVWQPAPAAFDGSRGLYASDEDMFAFLVDNDRRIFETGPAGGLGRGFFVWNSEVGKSSFGITTFWYEYVCGNHRVWGAQNVSTIRVPHVGNADERAWTKIAVEVAKYADASAGADEAAVRRQRGYVLGATRADALDTLFGLRIPELTQALATRAMARAEEREDWYGNPRSVWGFTGGLTEIARDLPHADQRVALERVAGKVAQIAF